jgi:hypothetical protein
VHWTGGTVSLPERRAIETDTPAALQSPVRKPFRALLRKEFQSHHVNLLLAAALLFLHLMVVAFRWLGSEYLEAHKSTEQMLETFPLLWLVMPALVGAMTIAEERKLGTLESQLSLPTGRWLQFFVKFVVAMALGFLLGGIMPLLIEGLSSQLHSHGRLFGTGYEMFNDIKSFILIFLVGSLILTFLSIFASSLTRNTLQALGLAVLASFPTVIFIVGPVEYVGPNPPFLQSTLFALVSWPLMILTVTWLTYKNYQCVQVDLRTIRRNVLVPLLTLAAASVATLLIYFWVWEF